ncbi:MAG: hypothetical protein ACPKQO_01105 [Nitrososphaeraceae archaeon]
MSISIMMMTSFHHNSPSINQSILEIYAQSNTTNPEEQNSKDDNKIEKKKNEQINDSNKDKKKDKDKDKKKDKDKDKKKDKDKDNTSNKTKNSLSSILDSAYRSFPIIAIDIPKIYETIENGETYRFNITNPNGLVQVDEVKKDNVFTKQNLDGSWRIDYGKPRIDIHTKDAGIIPDKAFLETNLSINPVKDWNFSKLHEKGYWYKPSDWKNVEVTLIFKLLDSSRSKDSQHSVSIVTRSITHAQLDNEYDDDDEPKFFCGGSSYHNNISNEGNVRMKKEQFHIDYEWERYNESLSVGNIYDKIIGFKGIVYNINDTAVKLETWVDAENEGKGPYKKIHEKIDSGDWGDNMEKCGAETDGQAITWGSPTVILKANDFKFDIYDIEVREILVPNQEDELLSLEEKKKEDKQMIDLTSSDTNTEKKNEKTDSLLSSNDITEIKDKEKKKSLTSSAVENEALTAETSSSPTILKNKTKENNDNATVDNVLEIISKDKNSNNDKNLIVESDIYLENIDKVGFLRVVGFINSQEFSKDIPLSNIADSTKKLPVKFIADTENDITEADSSDEFFICAYHIKNNNNSFDSIDYFDCNDGDIKSKSSPTKLNLFKPSSQIYQTSINYHDTYMNTKNDSYIDDNYGKNSNLNLLNTKEKVNVEIIVPLKDKKNIEKIKVMAMLKGQTQSEIIDVQEELDKIEGSTIEKIFVFDRETDIGKIQIGDRFYACVSGEELRPPEGMECEKRLIKSLDKNNKLVAR